MQRVRAFAVIFLANDGSVSHTNGIQYGVRFFLLTVLGICALGLNASAATVPQVRTQCEIKRIAKACFETGFTELQFKDAKHRKLAVHFFKLACSIQKHAPCTKNENKLAARAYYNSPDRAPVQILAKAPVTAPKIPNSVRSTSFSSNAPPPAQEPENRAPLEPLHPQPQIPPPPPPQAEMAPQPMPASACAPNDPNCGMNQPPPPQ